MIYYFLYMSKKEPDGSSKLPNDSKGDFGLFEYNGWYLGKTEDPELLYRISEFNPVPITENVAKGFKFLNIDTIIEEDENGEEIIRELTEEELSYKNEALNFMNKLLKRSEINNYIDVYDSLADTTKLLLLLVYTVVNDDTELKTNLQSYLNQYNFQIKDKLLNLDEIKEMLNKIFSRQEYLTGILNK